MSTEEEKKWSLRLRFPGFLRRYTSSYTSVQDGEEKVPPKTSAQLYEELEKRKGMEFGFNRLNLLGIKSALQHDRSFTTNDEAIIPLAKAITSERDQRAVEANVAELNSTSSLLYLLAEITNSPLKARDPQNFNSVLGEIDADIRRRYFLSPVLVILHVPIISNDSTQAVVEEFASLSRSTSKKIALCTITSDHDIVAKVGNQFLPINIS